MSRDSLELDEQSGWIKDIIRVPSPNFDERPDSSGIDVLVIHAISLPPGCYGGNYVEQLFTNRLDPLEHAYFEEIHQLRVSAHFFINRSGEINQFVSTLSRAWHAGISRFGEREKVNDFSIGIELEGCDEQSFEDAQYHALIELTHCLIRCYPGIVPEHIVGHCHIAPERKTDPGPCFDWDQYLNAIRRGPVSD